MGPASARLQLFILFGVPLISGFLGLFMLFFGIHGFLSAFLLFAGGWFVVSSKIKLKSRTQAVIEWGSEGMTYKERRSYHFGYMLMALSIMIWVIGISKAKGWS